MNAVVSDVWCRSNCRKWGHVGYGCERFCEGVMTTQSRKLGVNASISNGC